jgi:hypothetical protein
MNDYISQCNGILWVIQNKDIISLSINWKKL